MEFKLRFDKSELVHWASRYSYNDDAGVEGIGLQAQAAKCLTKAEFLTLCYWKSPRTQHHCKLNREDFIREVTRISLVTPNEQVRIKVLTLLNGVSWPTASVVLHFCHLDPYPILDFRALWSLNVETSRPDDFSLWEAYVRYCRNLAETCSVPMRVLDRALWQYSKERQVPG